MNEYLLDDIPLMRQHMIAHETNLLSMTMNMQEDFKRTQTKKFQKDKFTHESLEEGQTRVIKYYRQVQFVLYSLVSVVSIAVLILSILRVEYSWDSQKFIYKDTKTTKKFAYSCFALSLFSVILILFIMFFNFRIYTMKILFPLSIFQYLITGKNLILALLEIAISFIHCFFFCPPDNFWFLFISFFKIYPFFFVTRNFSLVYKSRAFIRQLFRIFSLTIPSFNSSLVIREFAFRRPAIFFSVGVVFMLIVFAYLFFISERPSRGGDPDSELNYWATIYWAAITSATVGYGDISPTLTNIFSVFITSLVALIGAIILAMAIGIIVNQTELQENECSLLEISQRLKVIDEQKKCAAEVILALLELRVTEKTIPENMNVGDDRTVRNIQRKFVDALYKFNKVTWKVEHVVKFNFSNNVTDSALYLKKSADVHLESTKFLKKISNRMELISNNFMVMMDKSIEGLKKIEDELDEMN
ncbi:hypothetical protein M9Y10_009535 [Tritrichomonas musculus]|uniref:Potassium channel domain-containing protein n=1 Tax=Tritrichomonas musculus TaxID=1915356 RepID=A0ABR2INT0_9EUKA